MLAALSSAIVPSNSMTLPTPGLSTTYEPFIMNRSLPDEDPAWPPLFDDPPSTLLFWNSELPLMVSAPPLVTKIAPP